MMTSFEIFSRVMGLLGLGCALYYFFGYHLKTQMERKQMIQRDHAARMEREGRRLAEERFRPQKPTPPEPSQNIEGGWTLEPTTQCRHPEGHREVEIVEDETSPFVRRVTNYCRECQIYKVSYAGQDNKTPKKEPVTLWELLKGD